MAVNSLALKAVELTADDINVHLGIAPPITGLQLSQITDILSKVAGAYSAIIDCSTLPPPLFVSALAAYIESGFIALLVFTTAGSTEHVVTVFGHARNSDQWHPQAIPAYGGPSSAPYLPGSAWISQFLIHDDNFGPYYTLSTRALTEIASVKAHYIIPVLPFAPTIPPHLAEIFGSILLQNNLPALLRLGKESGLTI